MLTQLFRFGATRHRLRKGYVVSGPNAAAVVAAMDRVARSVGEPPEAAVRDSTAPNAVWFDTGYSAVHTPAARAAVFARLAKLVAAASAFATQSRCLLLPNAVRQSRAEPWRNLLCPDFHVIETEHPAEQEVLCNLLRRHLPVLIAVGGRAGADPAGVEPVGSRLLSQSNRHLTARYLASVSPTYLKQVAEALRRDFGIGSLAAMDVGPLPESAAEPAAVEVRTTDGKALLSTASAEVLLLQALAMRARRVARQGDREADVPQWVAERDRVRAVAEGPASRLEVRPARPLEKPPQSPDARPDGKVDDRPHTLAGWRAFLELVESLRYEFKALEATFDEMAPLVVGAGLRAVGAAGLVNENDYLRDLHRTCAARRVGFVPAVAAAVPQFRPSGPSEVAARNAELHPSLAAAVSNWWRSWLTADWPPPPLKAAKPPPAPRPPDPPRPAPPAPDRGRFARGLFDAFARVRSNAPGAKLECLNEYRQAGGPMELGDVLAALPPNQREQVWPWLTAGVPVCRVPADWADARAAEVAAAAQERFVIAELPADTPPAVVAAFAAGRPNGLQLFRLDVTGGKPSPAAFLVCLSPGGGS